jgi:Uma2 family endonuclease
MVANLSPMEALAPVIYPESDGQPMSDNTKQFRWIVTIKENLELLFANDPDVFVAGDLLWYPVEGSNTIRQAPDVLVAIGRPKGDRGSYQQWQEAGIPPQVVFEILSPSNRLGEMSRKQAFYEQHGVEEYYVYDPDRVDFTVWLRQDDRLQVVDLAETWTSPRLGISFALQPQDLIIYRPDGQQFLGFVDLDRLRQQAEQGRQQAEQERQQAEQERQQAEQRADAANQRADRAEENAAKLAAKLRELGIDPSAG